MIKLALGTVQFGLSYGINNKTGMVSESEVFEILKTAREKGIEILDTAFDYGDSEKVIGLFMKENPESFKVMSKYSPDSGLNPYDSAKKSLQTLNLNSVYGYMIHNFKTFLDAPNLWTDFKKLKDEGLTQKIGFSLYFPAELDYLIDNKIDFDLVQIPYSILDQRFSDYFPKLKKLDKEIHSRSSFLQGLVFQEITEIHPRFLKIKKKLKKIQETARELGITVASLCLNFVGYNTLIDQVLIGVDSLDNLKENIISLNDSALVEKVLSLLYSLAEADENIILPFNWK